MTNDMRQMQHDSCMLIILYNFVHRPFIGFLSEPSAARRKIPVQRTLDQTWHYSILTCCTRTKEFALLLEQACPQEQSGKARSPGALLPAPAPHPSGGPCSSKAWDCWGVSHHSLRVAGSSSGTGKATGRSTDGAEAKYTRGSSLTALVLGCIQQLPCSGSGRGLRAPVSSGSGTEGTMWAQRCVVLSYNALEGNSVWVSFLRANILLSDQMVNSIGKSSFDGICICKQNFIFNLFWDDPTNVCWYPLWSHSLRAQKIEEPFVHRFK